MRASNGSATSRLLRCRSACGCRRRSRPRRLPAQPGRHDALRRRSAGTEVEVQFTGARLADAQQILFYEPGITVTQPGSRPDRRGQDQAGDRARLPAGPARHARPHGHAASAICARSSVGALPEIKEIEPNNDFAAAAKDRARHDRQRRGRERRRRLLRRRGQEGRADHRRDRRPAAGLRLLRSLRRDPGHASVSSWPAPTTRRWCGRIACARSSPRQTARTSSRSARPSFGGNGALPVSPARRPLSATDGRAARRRQAGRDARRAAGWATCRAREPEKITLPAGADRRSFGLFAQRRARHRALGRMPFRLTELEQRAGSRAQQRAWPTATAVRSADRA